MSGLRELGCLSYFGGLTAICFINVPNLTSVSGLDACCPGQYHFLTERGYDRKGSSRSQLGGKY